MDHAPAAAGLAYRLKLQMQVLIFIITMTTIIAIMMTMITMTTIILMVVITRQFCFISNTDNLGATVDLGILELCLSGNQEFIMEVIQNYHLDY